MDLPSAQHWVRTHNPQNMESVHHACAHTPGGNMYCSCHGGGNEDPFDVSEIKYQLEEISLVALLPKYKPIHYLIICQINTRLAQINTIKTVTGGAYDDVCQLYKDISFFAARAGLHKDQARNAVASHENLPIANNLFEAKSWKARSVTLEFDWTFHQAIKEWSELGEEWVLAVSKEMDKLNAMVYLLHEQLATQKNRIEELYKKMKQTKCEMDTLTYELKACLIDLGSEEKRKSSEEEEMSNMKVFSVPYLHYVFDAPHWTEEDKLGKIALEARQLNNTAMDIEHRVYL